MKTLLALLILIGVSLAGEKAAGASTNTFTRPFFIFKDYNDRSNHGTPSGWMGDYRDLRLEMNCTNNPYSGPTCLKFTYDAKGSRYTDMIGVMWQHPSNNNGDLDGGIDLTGATQLTFWARGEVGGEIIETVMFGGAIGAYPDTDKTSIPLIRLSKEWSRHTIDLRELDLSYISCFFGWVASRFRNREGFIVYMDDIYLE